MILGRSRLLGSVFAGQLIWLIGLGAAGAWTLHQPRFLGPALFALAAWLALVVALLRSAASAWAPWRGPLQFLTSWLVFPLLRAIHDAFITHSADATLLRLDRALWGGKSLPEHLMTWIHPALSDVLSVAYLAFFAVVLIPVGVGTWHRRTLVAQRFFTGLTAMYALGFLGYVTVPASGPFWAFPAIFSYPPPGGALTHALVGAVQQGITGMDVFPSLHAGITAYVLGFLLLHRRWFAAALVAPILAGILVATLYLGYHYGVDLIAGLVLATGVLAFTRRSLRVSALGAPIDSDLPFLAAQ